MTGMPKYLHLQHFATEQDWLVARRRYITASDAPILCGLVDGKNAMTVWADKVSPDPPQPKREVFMRIGHATEQLNADLYEEATGRELFDDGAYTLCLSKTVPYIAATLDRRVHDHELGWGCHELKWQGKYNNKSLEQYWCQLQHQMWVCDYKWGSISILDASGGWDWYGFDRDDAFLSAYAALCRDFWSAVVCRMPPGPLDGSEATTAALKAAFPSDDGTEIVLPWEMRELDEEYRRLDGAVSAARKAYNEAEKEKQGTVNKIKAIMGSAKIGVMAGCRYELATVHKKAFLTPASSYRVLRRKGVDDEVG